MNRDVWDDTNRRWRPGFGSYMPEGALDFDNPKIPPPPSRLKTAIVWAIAFVIWGVVIAAFWLGLERIAEWMLRAAL